MKTIPCATMDELLAAELSMVLQAARQAYAKGTGPVRILDLATGPNDFLPGVVKGLERESIPCRLVLSDISPTYLKTGYANLEKVLSPKGLSNVTAVLADGRDLRKNLPVVSLYRNDGPSLEVPLEMVIADPDYRFLSSGYEDDKRKERFASGSFDLVLGQAPFSNMGNYGDAVDEAVRVLGKGGYLIVDERQVKEINEMVYRTRGALRGAKVRCTDLVKKRLAGKLEPRLAYTHEFTFPDEKDGPDISVQAGDRVTDTVLVYQKPVEGKVSRFLFS